MIYEKSQEIFQETKVCEEGKCYFAIDAASMVGLSEEKFLQK